MNTMQTLSYYLIRLIIGLGIFTGIVLIAIGGTLALNSGLKLAFFETGSYDYTYELRDCGGTYVFDDMKGVSEYVPSDDAEAVAACRDRVLGDARTRFVNQQQHRFVDGISLLFVGIFFALVAGFLYKKNKA
ncbi:MAG: hypothetical protein LRY46_02480 [Candidatus Pacebacteria bacterium]|nr:hypothetical protein [Candidatus Paceibacterota bacterium]MCD8563646.1 hypothetical protein [Candidatus Paceibacterota bacterium]